MVAEAVKEPKPTLNKNISVLNLNHTLKNTKKNIKNMTKKQIVKKLDQLQTLLDNIEEARIIDSHDPETWDSDTLYNLVASLKEALKLLEDKEEEEGLCSLVDEYNEEDE